MLTYYKRDIKTEVQTKILSFSAKNRTITDKPQTLLVVQILQRDSEPQHNIQ